MTRGTSGSRDDIQKYLLPTKNIPAEVRRRFSPYHTKSAQISAVADLESDGWLKEKALKTTVKMRKPKSVHERLLDRTWATFAKLGFTYMSNDLGATPWLVENSQRTIEIFAADDEVALIILCRYFDENKTQNFRADIEFLQDRRDKIIARVRAEFPGRKIRFILAASNCDVTAQTLTTLENSQISYMDEDVLDYYRELTGHLGKAAKYQLLGSLFANQKIPELEQRVSAIEARMGGHTYYSFVIEPERLLKIAYILHRTKANQGLMPTYQRLIRRPRLTAISKSVEDGGFFPNCLILNIDSGRRGGVRFDIQSGQIPGAASRTGTLYLPQTYRAAYVIDGQHRLYGYANSKRARQDLVPVVAFVDLDRAEQVRIFMQINEHQQAVPKNLRNTLNADLLSDSPNLRDKVRSLVLQVAQQLGETKSSPLYGRVLVGESVRSPVRCITIDAIKRGIERASYLGVFGRSDVVRAGTFYLGTNEHTVERLVEFIEICLEYVKNGLRNQWELGSAEGGFVFINNGIESLLRIFSDAVDHVVGERETSPFSIDPSKVFDEIKFLLDPMINHLQGLSPEERLEYRKQYGSGGSTRYWRRLQIAINSEVPEFNPPGLTDYVKNETKQFNKESADMVRELEYFLKGDIRSRLEDEFGAEWFRRGVPRAVQVDAGKMAVDKNVERDAEDEVEPWDCLYLLDYQNILTHDHARWTSLFEKRYTRPGDERARGSWKDRTKWLQKLNSIRNDVFHGGSVKESDYEFLITLVTWLVEGKVDNDL
ncbi:DGQHR domain-containing protein [Nocardia sp. NBC_00565]|uniref:DGQHR domain-containing protein n=1 Tax=Nocardia sp. NBC_00565 TaxID=2975993 RepID=UPI002E82259A|nr:DGQHR domain-containing protein [Nocardia sp. NBC_00565]WUC03522.1 DGQHR domain-containing protein [Nocardia sp. NBC_00565]